MGGHGGPVVLLEFGEEENPVSELAGKGLRIFPDGHADRAGVEGFVRAESAEAAARAQLDIGDRDSAGAATDKEGDSGARIGERHAEGARVFFPRGALHEGVHADLGPGAVVCEDHGARAVGIVRCLGPE